jgi:NAD(P)-dependent dehydrogenase (short-subunit alcohol dehydrogenase family)
MELGLAGKVALITGSSRGIGRGSALALADEGCGVVVTGRDQRALDEVATSVRSRNVKTVGIALDLREVNAAGTLIETVRSEFGGLDILVNNAGATRRGDFAALSDADWQDGFALKFFAHVRLARAAWPLLKERHGSLITIAGRSGPPAIVSGDGDYAFRYPAGRCRPRMLYCLKARQLAAWSEHRLGRWRDSGAVSLR